MMSILESHPIRPARSPVERALYRGHDLLKMSESGKSKFEARYCHDLPGPDDGLNRSCRSVASWASRCEVHLDMDKPAIRQRSIELLEQVGIPTLPTALANTRTWLSGGQRQRADRHVPACFPSILIADERPPPWTSPSRLRSSAGPAIPEQMHMSVSGSA
jgi:ABC-type microcin C transport system duplicated ATPase subunit YejF